jgi:hypothetical protein
VGESDWSTYLYLSISASVCFQTHVPELVWVEDEVVVSAVHVGGHQGPAQVVRPRRKHDATRRVLRDRGRNKRVKRALLAVRHVEARDKPGISISITISTSI